MTWLWALLAVNWLVMLWLGALLGALNALNAWLPRTLEQWTAETLQVSLRVPATGALYAAGIFAWLWLLPRR